MKKILVIAIVAMLPFIAFAQGAKKPTLMVIPSNNWFSKNNFMNQHDNLGKIEYVPDFEAAFMNSTDLKTAISTINDLMGLREFPLKDVESVLAAIKTRAAEDLADDHAAAESMLDMVLKRAKCDITLELTWEVKAQGMRKCVAVTLRGLDAYTSKQIATLQNQSDLTLAFDLGVELQKCLEGDFDNFCQGLMTYFDDMGQNGREVFLRIQTEDGSDIDLEAEEIEGVTIGEFIEEWLGNNCVNGSFSTLDATCTMMEFEQVRIPLFNDKGRAVDTRGWARGLVNEIKNTGGFTGTKLKMRGLGEATVFIVR
jgi:hypothetical protein